MSYTLLTAYNDLGRYFISQAESSRTLISPHLGRSRALAQSNCIYFEPFERRILQINLRRTVPNADFDYYFTSFEYANIQMPFLGVDIQFWPFNLAWLWEVRGLWLDQRVSESRMDAYLRRSAARR